MEEAEDSNVSYRLNREMTGIWAWFGRKWESKWFRWGVYALAALLIFISLFWLLFVRNLPNADGLLEYESLPQCQWNW